MASMEEQWWIRAFPIQDGTVWMGRYRLTAPHLLWCLRCGLGTAVASALAFVVPPPFVTPQARFFAVVVPALATLPTVGATLRGLLVGLPFIIFFNFAAALLSSSLPPTPAAPAAVLALGVAAAEWAGSAGAFGGLAKKLGSGLFATVVLNAAAASVSSRGPLDAAIALTVGLACGYCGALVAAFVPFPVFAVSRLASDFARASLAIHHLLILLFTAVNRSSPDFRERILLEISLLDEAVRGLASASECRFETWWLSYAAVAEWRSFFARVRYSLKGIQLALAQRVVLLPADEDFQHYRAFRASLELTEMQAATVVADHFALLARGPSGPVHVQAVADAFTLLKAQVLSARRDFVAVEIGRLHRGIHHWPGPLRSDFFSSYASLACFAQIVEAVQSFRQPPLASRLSSLTPSLASLVRFLFVPWAPARGSTLVRLVNCLLLVLACLVTGSFVLVPEVARLFPSGVSGVVTVIFVHQNVGFGSSLRASRERLTGVVVGGTFALFLTPVVNSPYAVTAAMTGWVTFALFVLGKDSLYTAQSSIFAVGLALYTTTIENSFLVMSNYILANSFAVVCLIAIAAVLWVFSLLTSQPRLLATFSEFAHTASAAVAVVVARLTEDPAAAEKVPHPVVNVAVLEELLARTEALQVETEAEPVLLSLAPHSRSQVLQEPLRRIVTLVRALDEASTAVNEHLADLVQFKVVNPELVAGLRGLSGALSDAFQSCAEMMTSIPDPCRRFLVSWNPSAVAAARSACLMSAVRSLQFSSTSDSLIGSRAVVRLVWAVFALENLSLQVEELFSVVFELAAASRNSQKRSVLR